ncbi:serine/threonine-protein kinase [Schlesneria sp. T3-172]|uniref:serine/threonine-protein kinase n=1 Tax=Schlesneria sphaerica TaxID=3373610 RepID=UPI0037CC6D38
MTNPTQFAEEQWSQLEAALEAFSQAWEESPLPPTITEYLSECDEDLRLSLAVELVKIDLEQRWQRGLRRVIEDYVAEIPELAERITPQLVLEEVHVRKRAGDRVSTQDVLDRFPHLSQPLERMLVLDPTQQSTVIHSGNLDAVHLEPGESIDDFELLARLGQGAFATVFLARQRSMQRIVAVKISADQGDEPQTLAQLDHNNIVRVYDQRSVTGRGLRLLYMQYAAGGTLASVLASLQTIDPSQWSGKHYLWAIDQALDTRGDSPPAESSVRQKLAEMSWPQVVCWLGAQLSRALDYAHRQGVLHRDLKPANVLLTAEGVPKLADFNISFSKNVEGASAAEFFGGSLAYMSPEQLEAFDHRSGRTPDSLDNRSDLYALGVLIWELLTGERPFSTDVQREGRPPVLKKMIEARQQGPGRIPERWRREGLGLHEILDRCLSPLPEHRYGSCLELAQEIELCLEPDARNLLRRPDGGWRYWARKFPLSTVTILTLIPNLIGAIFNFLYNYRVILENLPGSEPTFMRIQSIINMIAFPTGILCAGWLAGSVAKATHIDSKQPLPPGELAKQRRRCLDLGNVAALVGLTLWLLAAPAYPVSLHLIVGHVPFDIYVQFVASLAICGLIAAAYPFFGVAIVSVRAFYPSLIDRESMTADDRQDLIRLSRQTWLYLVLAASVPMIAVLILAIGQSENRSALVVLAASGAIGYAIAISAFRLLQTDLTTLSKVISNRRDR